jgi:RNA polymerase sporulation-specific sigma factor
MNYAEIENCVIAAKEGNREELQKLLEQYKPFIFKTALSFNVKNFDTSDMVQIGYLALINAVSKYRTGSSTFSSYAFNSIKNAFRYTARQNSKYTREFSLNSPLNADTDKETEFVDNIAAPENLEEDILKSQEIKELRRALSNLSHDEIELVTMIYYNKSTLRNYADKKNFRYSQAVRKRDKILGKLNCYIN